MKPNALTLLTVLAALLFPSCNALVPRSATTPDRIRPHCSKAWVTVRMGNPEAKEDWTVGKEVVGEIWHYQDYWWARDAWAEPFGSWDLFFDEEERYAGWRLVSPRPQSPNAREVFFDYSREKPQPNEGEPKVKGMHALTAGS